MSNSPLVIGVTGHARHGKGEVAKVLVEEYGYTEMQFSGQLKAMALKLAPWVEAHGAPRNEVLDLRHVVERDGWDMAKQNPEVRRILQVLGTECVRDMLGQDSWVTALDLAWVGTKPIVISDVRFPNEVEFVKAHGVLIRVERPGFENGVDPQHPSEKIVQTLLADHRISNDGTLEDLRLAVRSYMLQFE